MHIYLAGVMLRTVQGTTVMVPVRYEEQAAAAEAVTAQIGEMLSLILTQPIANAGMSVQDFLSQIGIAGIQVVTGKVQVQSPVLTPAAPKLIL